jgi:hypothetical protein
MSAVARLFGEWWAGRYPDDHPDGTEFDKDDLAEAYAAGWEACYHARWEPVGGLPGAQFHGGVDVR